MKRKIEKILDAIRFIKITKLRFSLLTCELKILNKIIKKILIIGYPSTQQEYDILSESIIEYENEIHELYMDFIDPAKNKLNDYRKSKERIK